MAKVGYARVSTPDQGLDLQIDALNNAGCDRIFSEKRSAFSDRPEYEAMREYVHKGDTLVVWKLDRLGRSMTQLVALMGELQEEGVDFISLSDGIDTVRTKASRGGKRITFLKNDP